MAYKSLYRTYRPQTFEDVAGQEAIITTLRHAVEENKIAHAYLFCGPRGTGKTTIAKLLAKAINCTGDPKPCGECDNCKEIENSSHPDVIEIDAASNNGVEEVRSLIEKVKYAPTQGHYKVYIIDEVHMMSTGAFNALLKTLEEPPAHVVFILATTEPHKVLPTIISRCQRFDFSRLTDQEMIDRMKDVIASEHKNVDDGALALIAKLANGGMRDALSILEQCLAYNDEHLSEDDVNAIYGIVSMQDKIDLIKVMLSKNMSKALEILEKMDSNGTDIKRLTYDLIDILKDVIIYKNTQNSSILFVLSNDYIQEIVPYISSDEALAFIDLLMDATEKYAKAINAHVYFELAVLKMCNQDHGNTEQAIPMAPQPAKIAEVKRAPIQENKKPVTQMVIEKVTKEELPNDPQDEIIDEGPIGEPLEENEEIIEEMNEPVIEEVKEEEKDGQEEPPAFHFEQQETVDDYHAEDDIVVDQNDIMNILVQADRHVLNDIQEKWPIIKRYMANMNTAKAASMLCDGKPVAACDQAIVIAFEHMPDVNAVNYYKNYKQLASFLKEVFSHDYRFVAMQQEEWVKLRSYYIQRSKMKELPEPGSITLKHIDQYDIDHVELNEAQQYAVDLFGEDIVEFTED